MGQEFEFRDILGKIGYRYSWKIIELVTIILLARLLDVIEFGLAFLAVSVAYFAMNLLNTAAREYETKKVKKFFNTLSVSAPLAGIIVSVFVFLMSYLLVPDLVGIFRFSSVIIFLSSLSLTPEVYFFSRDMEEKIYRSYLVSQVAMSAFTLIMVFYGFKSIAVLYGYTLFYLVHIINLWMQFPFKLKPKASMDMIRKMFYYWSDNIINFLTIAFLSHGILLYVALKFGISGFAYLFMAFYAGFFLYENITIFINSLLIPNFEESLENQDLFRLNLVRLLEYFTFIIVPLSTIVIALSKEITMVIFGGEWLNANSVMAMLFFAGLLKGITETCRIALLVKEKAKVVERIRSLELIVLYVLVFAFGSFGLTGVGIAFALTAIVTSLLYIAVSTRLKVGIFTLSRDYTYIIFSGIVSSLLVGLLKETFFVKRSVSVILLFGLGILFYFGLTLFFNKDFYRRFVRFAFGLVEE